MFDALKKIFAPSLRIENIPSEDSALAKTAAAPLNKPSKDPQILGNESLANGKLEEAAHWYRKSIELNPAVPDSYVNLSYVLSEQKNYKEAEKISRQAVLLGKDNADAFFLHGMILRELGKAEEAVDAFRKATQLKANFGDAHCSLIDLLIALGRSEDALQASVCALREMNGYGPVHWNAAFVFLLMGDFVRGWKEHEWRWEAPLHAQRRNFVQPLWLGQEDIAGKVILLHAEQGLGDTLNFCRYAKLVKELGAQVILEVQKELKSLMSTLDGPDRIIGRGEALPSFDYQTPLLSLPLAFNTTLENIPAPPAYLRCADEAGEKWRLRLKEKTKPRVGLVWSGNPNQKNDHNRSIPLMNFVSLLREDIEWVSLQKEIRVHDRDILSRSSILHFGDELNDFADTAGLIEQVDLVIAVDTSIAHLVGAMGKPLWFLVPYVADWRWLLNREDTPWYPTARLIRQPKLGDWNSVMARLEKELSTWVAQVSA
jgi:hypothetical protein